MNFKGYKNNRAAGYVATIRGRLAAATAVTVEARRAEAVRVERAVVEAEAHREGVAYQAMLDAHRAAAGIRASRAALGLDMPARRPVR